MVVADWKFIILKNQPPFEFLIYSYFQVDMLMNSKDLLSLLFTYR